jgi:outer membrane lipoprotein SlyB
MAHWNPNMMLKHLRFRHARLFAVAATTAALSACVVAPPPRPAPPPPPPNVTVYAYPQQGQTPAQQDRDRYECSNWATEQTGFNPSAPNVPPHERVQVVSGTPPGAGVAVGAVTGGILGAAVSSPRNAGAGLLLGALVGGAIGAGAEASANAQAQAQANASVNAQTQAQAARIERKAADYRRAVGACLEGRGYSVH